jgi:hypothetical protein
MKRITRYATATSLFALSTAALIGPAAAHHTATVFGSDTGGPITTIQATTAEQGAFIAGINLQYVGVDEFTDTELETLAGNHIHGHSADYVLSPSLGLAYGVTDDFTLSFVLPFVERHNLREGSHHHSSGMSINEVEKLGNIGGLGDATLLGEYRFLNADEMDFEASVLFSLKMPTGSTHKKSPDGERLETEHQPGSGSWDPSFGLAVTKRLNRVSLDANVLYTFTSRGSQETELGDRFAYNAAVSYRFAGIRHEHEEGVVEWHSAWDFVVELNGHVEDEQRVEGETEQHTSGSYLLVSPGVRYTSESRWSAYVSVGVPVFNDMGAAEPDLNVQVLAGFAKAF